MDKPKTNYKICIQCGKKKIRKIHFHKNVDSPDGYRNICKSCRGVNKPHKRKNKYPFFNSAIIQLCGQHKHIEVKKFGFFYGILIYIRPAEILAFSVLADTEKGSETFKTEREARAWLYKFAIYAGNRTLIGLTKGIKID
jgi:hypothetical protein